MAREHGGALHLFLSEWWPYFSVDGKFSFCHKGAGTTGLQQSHGVEAVARAVGQRLWCREVQG